MALPFGLSRYGGEAVSDQPKNYAEVSQVSTESWVPLPPEEWTEPERWVWEQVRTGRLADLNQCYGKDLDPKNDSLWVGKEKERRTLRPDFLRTILLSKPWRDLITHVGVRIFGAYFDGPMDLTSAAVLCELWIDQSFLEGGLNCDGSSFDFTFSLAGSVVNSSFSLNNALLNSNLNLKNTRHAIISLLRAQIKGTLLLEQSEVTGNLCLDGAKVEGDLYLKDGVFTEVHLPDLWVGGQLSMTGSEFKGKVGIYSAVINKTLFLRNCTFHESLIIIFSSIGGNLHLRGASLQSLDLRGTRVRAIIDGGIPWPDHLEVEGLTYQHLGGMGEHLGQDHMTSRPGSWFVALLAKQEKYSPQPYLQCAKVLREAGQPWKAAEVLFAGKERERKSSPWLRKAWLGLMRWSVGYGLGWRFKVFPSILATPVLFIGALVCAASSDAHSVKHSLWWCLGLSLDRLLPVIQLSKDYSDVVFHGWQRAWFMGQGLFGWVLAFFIAAGLAGVGKPGGRD